MTEYISVGKLQKPHGIHGAFHFMLYHNMKKQPTTFFIETNGSTLPYFIKSMDHQTIVFEEVSQREAAKPLVNAELMVRSKDLNKYFTVAEDLSYLVGYTVHSNGRLLGTIEAVEDSGLQWLAQLFVDEREVLLPLVDELILEINEQKRELHYQMPEGLI